MSTIPHLPYLFHSKKKMIDYTLIPRTSYEVFILLKRHLTINLPKPFDNPHRKQYGIVKK